MAVSGRFSHFLVQHDVRIGRTVVHSGRKGGHAGPLERIAGFRMFLHPPAEIQYGGLAGSEIDERVSFQYQQDIQIVRKFPVHPVCADIRRYVGGIYQKDHIRGVPVLVRQLPVVTAYHLESVKIALATVVAQAYIVVEVQFSELPDVPGIFAGEQQGGRDGEIVHEAGTFLPADTFQEYAVHLSGKHPVAGDSFREAAEVGKQGVRPADVLQTLAVVVVVIVDYGCVGSFPLGDVREQSGTAEQVDEHRPVAETLQDFSELRCEHAFLSHKRKRGLAVIALFIAVIILSCN